MQKSTIVTLVIIVCSLGAQFDGVSNLCSVKDAYIMASLYIPQQDSNKASNPWTFSTCSTDYFTSQINTLESWVLETSTKRTAQLVWSGVWFWDWMFTLVTLITNQKDHSFENFEMKLIWKHKKKRKFMYFLDFLCIYIHLLIVKFDFFFQFVPILLYTFIQFQIH